MTDFRQSDGYTDYRREVRTKQNIYECPPPPPVVLCCGVCNTAEKPGCNLWTCLPFLSYSSLCGPTLADIVISLLSLLPLSFVSWLAIGHPKCCQAKPPTIKYDPINKKQKYYSTTYGDCGDNGGDLGSSGENLSEWMRREYVCLARELADLQRLTSEDNSPECGDLLQARNYVLDRLAEMLAKREEIEKRIKIKKKKGLD